DLNIILQASNECHDSLKFTLEEEQDGALSFLDLKIIRNMQSLAFKIFRKPSNNLLVINYFSSHEYKIKISGIICMYLRALKFVSPEHMDEEFKIISEIVKLNDYPDKINKIAID
ncbi:unnamed protein product, partial [Rotaria socialis]